MRKKIFEEIFDVWILLLKIIHMDKKINSISSERNDNRKFFFLLKIVFNGTNSEIIMDTHYTGCVFNLNMYFNYRFLSSKESLFSSIIVSIEKIQTVENPRKTLIFSCISQTTLSNGMIFGI